MRKSQTFPNLFRISVMLIALTAFGHAVAFDAAAGDVPNLEGKWKGWGGVVLTRDTDLTYTGTYQDTYGEEEGKILLELFNEVDGEYSGEWWEGDARIGKLTFSVDSEGTSIRGTWCALESSKIKPGYPSCSKPKRFSWWR